MTHLRLLGPLGLSTAGGDDVRAVLAQPKRLAVLAYLAASAEGFHRRDTLLALFWPEATERQARLALRQAVHHLRRALGAGVIVNRGNAEIGIAPDALWCDVAAFRRAVADGELATALELYRGHFLDGFSLAGISVELERWLEDERAALRALAVDAASSLAERAAEASDSALAVLWARRAFTLSGGAEPTLRQLLRVLDRRGDRAGALRTAADFARRLREELGADPAPETAALVTAIRGRAEALPDDEPTDAPPADVVATTTRAPIPVPRSMFDSRRAVAIALPAAALVVVAVAGLHAARPDAPTVARSFFDEGLRTYYRVGAEQSNPFFRAALREDSTCALCAYYAAITEGAPDALRHLRAAVRLADRAPERQRRDIQATWSRLTGVAPMLATAESVATRYPDDPGSELEMAAALGNAGRWLASVRHLRRAIELDTLAPRGPSPRCRACDARGTLVHTYWAADSFPAAERAAREWIRAQPRSSAAWTALADTYQRMGRYAAARAVRDTALRLGPAGESAGDAHARSAIRRGDFAAADAYLASRVRDGDPRTRADALWWLTVSLRNQGRLHEALATTERMRRVADIANPGVSGYPTTLARGQVLFELGRYREAASLFRSLASERPSFIEGFPGIRVRHRCWALTHEAEALAALGDTTAILALADTVQRLGPRSAYGRDRLLHHHLRGLVAEARGDWPAAEREFRSALYSVTDGYTRTNLHLARVLLAERRPRAAIAVLQPVLRGGLEGSGLYVTRTEIHQALGRAFALAGEPDSAAVHDAAVARAWAHASARLDGRVASR